jgi:subtilisin family serine protease
MRILVALLLWFVAHPVWGAAKIDPSLSTFVRGEVRTKTVPVLAIMDWQQTSQVPQVYQTAEVIQYLKWQANQGWDKVSKYLQNSYSDTANHVQPQHLFFLNNSFSALVTVEGLRRISQAPGVSKIYLNYEFRFDDPFPSPDYTLELATYRYNLRMIGIDRLAQEFRDLDGRGVILGAIDTGVDGQHPDLRGKVPFMFNAKTNKVESPRDLMYHGTHVAGILAGGNRTDRLIGVAPGATLTVAMASTLEEILQGMHFMLDTDNNPHTYYDMPRAVNNSWGSLTAGTPFPGFGPAESGLCPSNSIMPDQEPFYRAISAWEAAGIIPVFSAGNCGPGIRTITPPKEHPASITVGSLNMTARVLPDSSRGPAVFQGKDVFKPELTAPGLDILSVMPGGRHQKLSGTSMAAPHVTGTIALIVQANPRLSPADIKDILIRTAYPRNRDGSPGTYGQWTPEYGYGVLNAYEAVKMALSWGRPATGNILGTISSLFWPFSVSIKNATDTRPRREIRYLDEALEFPSELESGTWLNAEDVF